MLRVIRAALGLFQSTPLREGRLRIAAAAGIVWFRSTPRPCARGDLAGYEVREYLLEFQSTPLREGRQGLQDI